MTVPDFISDLKILVMNQCEQRDLDCAPLPDAPGRPFPDTWLLSGRGLEQEGRSSAEALRSRGVLDIWEDPEDLGSVHVAMLRSHWLPPQIPLRKSVFEVCVRCVVCEMLRLPLHVCIPRKCHSSAPRTRGVTCRANTKRLLCHVRSVCTTPAKSHGSLYGGQASLVDGLCRRG